MSIEKSVLINSSNNILVYYSLPSFLTEKKNDNVKLLSEINTTLSSKSLKTWITIIILTSCLSAALVLRKVTENLRFSKIIISVVININVLTIRSSDHFWKKKKQFLKNIKWQEKVMVTLEKSFSYLSFTMTFACSSISISSASSFTVLIIPFSLFSSFNSSYCPFSNADLQRCRSVTCNKTQIY